MPWRTIDVELRARVSGFRSEMGAAAGIVTDFGHKANAALTGAGQSTAQLRRSAENLTAVGGTLSRYVSLPLAAAGIASIKLATDFETSMSRIQGLSGIAANQIGALREQVLKLSGETARSPQELADALYFITSSGLSGSKAIDVLTASAKAATAGLGDTGTVARLITSAVVAYGAENLTAAHATDVLVAAVRQGQAEPAELANSLGRVIPIAKAMGVSFDDVAAAVAVMTKSGLNADEAVTALRAILADILNPAAQSEKQLKALGISSDGLRQTLREKGLLATLFQLKDEIGGNTDQLANIIPNVRGLTGFLNLMGQDAAGVQKIFGATKNSTGDLDKAFAAFTATSAFKLQKATNDAKVGLTALGGEIAPLAAQILPPLISGIRLLGGVFGSLPGPVRDFIVVAAGMAVIAGPVLSAVGNLRRVEAAITGIRGASDRAGVAVGRLPRLLAGITATAGLIGIDLLFSRIAGNAAKAGAFAGQTATKAGSDLKDQLKAVNDEIARQEKVLHGGGIRGATISIPGTDIKIRPFDWTEHTKAADRLGALKQKAADLQAQIKGLDADQKNLVGTTGDLTDATGALGGVVKTTFDEFLDARQAAQSVAEAEAQLSKTLEDQAANADDAERASISLDRAREQLTDAEQKLADVRAKSQADVVAEAELNAADATESGVEAKKALTTAEKHLADLRKAGRSPKAISDAEDQLARARIAAGKATDAEKKAQKELNDARSGVTRAREIHDAELGVRQAKLDVAAAERDKRKAEDESSSSDRGLAARQREIAGAIDGVVGALDAELKKLVESGAVADTTAGKNAWLRDKLEELKKKYPELSKPIDEFIAKLGETTTAAQAAGTGAAAGLNPLGVKLDELSPKAQSLSNYLAMVAGFTPPNIPSPPAGAPAGRDPNTGQATGTVGAGGAGGGPSNLGDIYAVATGRNPNSRARGGSVTGGWYLLGDEGTAPELLQLAAGSRGWVYPHSQTRSMLRGGVRGVPMAAGGWVGNRLPADAGGRSTVHIVRVTERVEPMVNHISGPDPRQVVSALEGHVRRREISRSLSDAGAGDWTR